MLGSVDRLVPEQGFGFIRGDEGREYFFHRSALLGVEFEQLAPNVPVIFDVKEHAQGDAPEEHPRAVSIRLAEDAPPVVEHTVLPPAKTR